MNNFLAVPITRFFREHYTCNHRKYILSPFSVFKTEIPTVGFFLLSKRKEGDQQLGEIAKFKFSDPSSRQSSFIASNNALLK